MTADALAAKHVRMANQIAAFFRAYPHDEAVAGVRDHLASFWTRKMRALVTDHHAAGGRDLDPLVVAALDRPPSAESPIRRETAGPGELGAMASDAG